MWPPASKERWKWGEIGRALHTGSRIVLNRIRHSVGAQVVARYVQINLVGEILAEKSYVRTAAHHLLPGDLRVEQTVAGLLGIGIECIRDVGVGLIVILKKDTALIRPRHCQGEVGSDARRHRHAEPWRHRRGHLGRIRQSVGGQINELARREFGYELGVLGVDPTTAGREFKIAAQIGFELQLSTVYIRRSRVRRDADGYVVYEQKDAALNVRIVASVERHVRSNRSAGKRPVGLQADLNIGEFFRSVGGGAGKVESARVEATACRQICEDILGYLEIGAEGPRRLHKSRLLVLRARG